MDSRFKLRVGLEVVGEVVEPNFLKVVPSSIEKDNKVGSIDIDIESNTNWYLTPSSTVPNWFSLSQTTGSNNQTITIDFLLNDTGSDRTQTITFTYEGSDFNYTLTITQLA